MLHRNVQNGYTQIRFFNIYGWFNIMFASYADNKMYVDKLFMHIYYKIVIVSHLANYNAVNLLRL